MGGGGEQCVTKTKQVSEQACEEVCLTKTYNSFSCIPNMSSIFFDYKLQLHQQREGESRGVHCGAWSRTEDQPLLALAHDWQVDVYQEEGEVLKGSEYPGLPIVR